MNLPRLIDSNGRTVPIDRQLAAGGEGAVYTIANTPNFVAKVYHKPPDDQKVEKLTVMTGMVNPRLLDLAAWPTGLLRYENGREVAGFVMPKMIESEEVQRLYNPIMRLKFFPQSTWAFQVRAAYNLAAAFDEVHKAGCLVGDVNQSFAFVSKQALVKLIDCDSFQIQKNGKSYLCEVGTPHYVPPELQGKSLRGITRTENHDRFGLAVLIFQLLFVGRHPYAGIFNGKGDPSFEQLIAEYRFFQGPLAHTWQMGAPRHTPVFADISPEVGMLFRRAFERGSENAARPKAADWLPTLKLLEQATIECKADAGHKYWKGANGCVWCRLAEKGGPEFYYGASGVATTFAVDETKLQDVMRRLEAAKIVNFEYERRTYRTSKVYVGKPFAQYGILQVKDNRDRREGEQKARLEKLLADLNTEYQNSQNSLRLNRSTQEQKLKDREKTTENELKLKLDAIHTEYREKNKNRHLDFERSEIQAIEIEQTEKDDTIQKLKKLVDRELEYERVEVEAEVACNNHENELGVLLKEASKICLAYHGRHRVFARLLGVSGFCGVVLCASGLYSDEYYFFGFFVLFVTVAMATLFFVFSPYASAKIKFKMLEIQVSRAEGHTKRAARRVQQANRKIEFAKNLVRQKADQHLSQIHKRADSARQRAESDKEKLKQQGGLLLLKERKRTEREIQQIIQSRWKADQQLEIELQQLQLQFQNSETDLHEKAGQAILHIHQEARDITTKQLDAEAFARKNVSLKAIEKLEQSEYLRLACVNEYTLRYKKLIFAINGIVPGIRELSTLYQSECKQIVVNSVAAARIRHLRLNLISDAIIDKIGPTRKQILAINNIFTAEDVHESVISDLSGFGEGLTRSLMEWKAKVIATFDASKVTSTSQIQDVSMRYRTRQQQYFVEIEQHLKELESLAPLCQQKLNQHLIEIRKAISEYDQAEADCQVVLRL